MDEIEARAEQDGQNEEEGLTLARVKELAGFFVGATRRNRRFSVGVALTVLAVTVALVVVLPRTYSAEIRIIAQNNVMATISNPDRRIPTEAENPTKGAANQIMRHDNLEALAKNVDLLNRWEATRSPVLRLKDRFFAWVYGQASEKDTGSRRSSCFSRKRLAVTTDQDSITIAVEWSNAQVAYDLVNAVYKNFLDARYDNNVAIIGEAITILQGRANDTEGIVESALTELKKIEEDKKNGVSAAPSGSASAVPPPAKCPRCCTRTEAGRCNVGHVRAHQGHRGGWQTYCVDG